MFILANMLFKFYRIIMDMDVFRMSLEVPHEDSNEVKNSSIAAIMVC